MTGESPAVPAGAVPAPALPVDLPPPAAAAPSADDAWHPVSALERLTELARRLLRTGAAEVHLQSDGPGSSLCALTTGTSEPVVVGDAAADPRLAGLPEVTGGDVGSLLAVPLTSARGAALGALCVHDGAPRSWTPADVELLGHLGRSVAAELELAAISDEYRDTLDRWQLAIDAAGVGSFDWDLVTGELRWDDRLLAMFGYGRDDVRTIADFEARLHPEDVPRVRGVLAAARASCSGWSAEYRVVHPDGTLHWITARGRALAGRDGTAERMLGAAYDSTDQRLGEASLVRVLESMSAAFYSLDAAWRFTYVNAEAERVLGRHREELLGGVIWDLFPAAVGSDFEHNYRAAVEQGRTVAFEAYYPAPLDGWYELRAAPGDDGLSVYFLDVTARRAAEAELQAAVRRAGLVADVTTQLSGTLDAEEAVARLASLLVPELSDFCIVTLVDDEGGLHDVGWAHADPALQEATARYAELRLDALRPTSDVATALRTGQTMVVAGPITERLSRIIAPGEAADLLLELLPRAVAILPMIARGRTVGLLNLFRGPQGRPFDEEDVATVRDIAGRAALALDNARLYEQQRRLAEQLQRSLLTPPPEPDHLQIAVRYQPAARAAQVGGDWYDAFQQPDGGTVVVIGDVVGHDTAAAAAMGQVRGLLRGIAYTTGFGPGDVLARLDAALEGLQVGTQASAVVARFEQTPDDLAADRTHLRWSNAGHPPPMVVLPDGTVQVLGGEQADLLLGIDPSSPRQQGHVVLQRGSTVVLCTDGLVERRGQHLDDGLDRLQAALAELDPLPLDALCDELLRRLPSPSHEDDVAIVAVRLHPQDRPRPVEAGPRRNAPGLPRAQ